MKYYSLMCILGRLSSEPETNGSSPPTLPYQQGDKYGDYSRIEKNIYLFFFSFRPIDHERNDSGAASPSDMYRMSKNCFFFKIDFD